MVLCFTSNLYRRSLTNGFLPICLQGIVRSTSFNQSDGIKALWRDNEAHADKLSRLEWHQRRLMERQITFDNRCEAFRRANSRVS